MSNLFLKFFFTFSLAFLVQTGFSQPPPPDDPPCWPPPCIPIDGGVSILLAAGALYGGKKIYQSLKQ